MSVVPRKQEAVAREIAGLADLSGAALVARWADLYGRPPPHKLSRQLMEKAFAYEIQSKAFGGLTASTRRALPSVLAGYKVPAPSRGLAPGTRLIREWNGKSYTVDVLDTGFRHDGETYKSLSAVARKITGARWSGPRFFGL